MIRDSEATYWIGCDDCDDPTWELVHNRVIIAQIRDTRDNVLDAHDYEVSVWNQNGAKIIFGGDGSLTKLFAAKTFAAGILRGLYPTK